MKKLTHIIATVLACTAGALIPSAEAETLEMTLTGTLNQNLGSGHPTIPLGSTYFYRTRITKPTGLFEGGGTLSLPYPATAAATFHSTEFKINGVDQPIIPMNHLIFYGDHEDHYRSAKFDAGSGLNTGYQVNSFSIHAPMEHDGYPYTPVGYTVQFSDFYVLNNWSFWAPYFEVYGGGGSGNKIRGDISSCSVINLDAPTIQVQPQGQTNSIGSSVTLSVVVTPQAGQDVTYMWHKDGDIFFPLTLSPTLQINNLQKSDFGDYYVVVANNNQKDAVVGVESAVAKVGVLVEHPFVDAAGVYNGLFYDTNSFGHNNSGFITLKVNTNRAFSGKLRLDGDVVSFSGKFASNGVVATNISRAKWGKENLSATIALDFATWSDELTGTVSSSTWTSSIIADRAVFNKVNLAFESNLYQTMILNGEDEDGSTPDGAGVSGLKLSTNGVATLTAGYMADGQRLKMKVPISKHGYWPVYSPVYKTIHVYTNLAITNVITLKTNKSYYVGSVMGWMSSAPSDTFGELSWIKPGWTNNVYPNGFTNQLFAIGFPYDRPAPGTPAFYPNGFVSLALGNLETELLNEFTLGLNNKVAVVPSPDSVRLTVSPNTGIITGSFIHPANPPKRTAIRAIILQPFDNAFGYFIGTNQSGLTAIY